MKVMNIGWEEGIITILLIGQAKAIDLCSMVPKSLHSKPKIQMNKDWTKSISNNIW